VAERSYDDIFSRKNLTIPNILSISRIVAIPFLIILILLDLRWVFFFCYIAAALTDLFDGLFARLLNQKTEIGKDLDAWGDVLFLLASAVFAWLLFPQYIKPAWGFIGVFLMILGTSILISVIKHKDAILMHTALAKIGAWGVIMVVMLSFFFNTSIIMIIIMCWYYVAFAEQILIFLTTPKGVEIDPDTPTYFHMQKKLRKLKEKEDAVIEETLDELLDDMDEEENTSKKKAKGKTTGKGKKGHGKGNAKKK
jgi:phosphatidylglycerophosphate synthase